MHKSTYTIDQWQAIFTKRGIDITRLECLPESTEGMTRLEEILRWFDTYKVDSAFVIIDDDTSLHTLPPDLKSHWIQTKPLIGLTPGHQVQAELILRMDIRLG